MHKKVNPLPGLKARGIGGRVLREESVHLDFAQYKPPTFQKIPLHPRRLPRGFGEVRIKEGASIRIERIHVIISSFNLGLYIAK